MGPIPSSSSRSSVLDVAYDATTLVWIVNTDPLMVLHAKL